MKRLLQKKRNFSVIVLKIKPSTNCKIGKNYLNFTNNYEKLFSIYCFFFYDPVISMF